jgi:threonine dehydrogenase-like Zn-dependent dehydrogenase
MHEALIRCEQGVSIAAVPTAAPGKGEILVAPFAVGICGTDLQILSGGRREQATILGHEAMAEVIAVGQGANGFAPGDRIVFNPVNPADQAEILGHSSEGLFQQRRIVTAAELAWGMAVRVDEPALDAVLGTLVEPLAAVLYGYELVEQTVTPQSVIIVGAGPIGLLAALSAQDRGARRVLLVTNSRRRREWVVSAGILLKRDVVVANDAHSLSASCTPGENTADAAFLCTPRRSARAMLEAILPMVRDGGCVDLVGGFADGDRVDSLPGLDLNAVRRSNVCGVPVPGLTVPWIDTAGKRVHLTGHRGTHPRHLASSQRLMSDQPGRYRAVITHRCSLAAAPALLARLTKRGEDGPRGELVKAIIDLRLEGRVVETAPAAFAMR